MSGFTTDFLEGLAVYLAAGGLGATYNTSGVYTVLQTGIKLGDLPQEPDRLIALTAYGVSDSPTLSDSVVGAQVVCRWSGEDPRPVDDLADAIFNLVHGMRNVTLPTGVVVVQCYRNSQSSLGQDVNHRWMNVANYYATVHRPSANRT